MLAASLLFVSIAHARQEHSAPELHVTPTPAEVDIERFDVRPVTNERLDQVMSVYEADESLQRTRPVWEPEAQPVPRQDQRSGPGPIARFIAGLFRAIGPIIGYLLILVVVIAILVGLYIVFGESLSLRRAQKEKKAETDLSIVPDLRPEQARAAALLEDADALAAKGRFAEAVHLLLFRSIDDIQEKRSGLIGRSLTAREIGALSGIPDSVRNALSPIIRIVERSFFGGREVDAEGWQEARTSYQTFAFGEAWT